MRVAFILFYRDYSSPRFPLEDSGGVRLGVSYISSTLRNEGCETKLWVHTPPRNPQDTIDSVKAYAPDLICFSGIASEYETLALLGRGLRRVLPTVPTVIGGPHASIYPEQALDGPFDVVCVGEGEHATQELVHAVVEGTTPDSIPNLQFKRGSTIQRNPCRDFNEELDELPFPDRELWMPWIRRPSVGVSVLVGRGCPFNCTYCCNHILKRQADGPYVRFRSPDNICREIEQVCNTYPTLDDVYLEVETLSANLDYARELCEALVKLNGQRSRPLRFGTNYRILPGRDEAPLFQDLARANILRLNIGLESGSERIRADVLNRMYTNKDVFTTVSEAKRNGLSVMLYVMVGIPGETREDFQETIACCRQSEADVARLTIFNPYPGTELHRRCVEEGLVGNQVDFGLERRQAVLDLPGFPRKAIQREFVWFYYNVHKGKKPLSTLLAKTAAAWVHSTPVTETVYRRFKQTPIHRLTTRVLKYQGRE